MSAAPDPESPFARVQSRREKTVTLVAFAFMTGLCASLPLFVEASIKDFHTWLALYGVLFFGSMSVHSWKSIRENWSIHEDNRASSGPLALFQSVWTMVALVALWLLARYFLP
jgi:hypothetical protein